MTSSTGFGGCTRPHGRCEPVGLYHGRERLSWGLGALSENVDCRAAALALAATRWQDEYLALQDFIWRHILRQAGKIALPVHIHSSLGVPPFLRSLESDVPNLEDVLADPAFFATPIVLIHGGGPWIEIAAYLALKPNVWVDISSIGFLYPVPDFADMLPKYLLFAPEGISPDGLTLIVNSTRPGGLGGEDLWMTTRATRSSPWAPLVHLDESINTPGEDAKPEFSADGSTLLFMSTRPGGQGFFDIWGKRLTKPVLS